MRSRRWHRKIGAGAFALLLVGCGSAWAEDKAPQPAEGGGVGVLRGIVRSAEGRGLVGCELRLFRRVDLLLAQWGEVGEAEEVTPVITGVSGANGEFAMSGLQIEEYAVQVRAAGSVHVFAGCVASPAVPPVLILDLQKTTPVIVGRVSDRHAPMAKSSVLLSAWPWPDPHRPHLNPISRVAGSPDPEGRFRLPGLPTGGTEGTNLIVRAMDRARTWRLTRFLRNWSGSAVQMTVGGTATLTGSIVDDTGAPLAGALVEVEVLCGDDDRCRARASTKATGDFELRELPSGLVEWVTLCLPDYGCSVNERAIWLDGGVAQHLNLRLERGRVVSGRVSLWNGQPAKNVRIVALDPATGFVDVARSDAEGSYSVVVPKQGPTWSREPRISLFVDAPGADLIAGGPLRIDASMGGDTRVPPAVIGKTRVVAGRVANEEGKGVAGLLVQIRRQRDKHIEDSDWVRESRTGSSGDFVVGNLVRGATYVLTARGAGGRGETLVNVDEGSDAPMAVELRLRPDLRKDQR